MSLSIKIAHFLIKVIGNRCPFSPTLCLCAFTACNVSLVYHNILCEDSVYAVTAIHLRCKPIQLTGVGNLVYVFSVFHCRLVVGVVIFAETVLVPGVNFTCGIFIVGVACPTCAKLSFVNHIVGAVQNRGRIGRLAVVQVLAENVCVARFAAVQQVGYFAAGELVGGFAGNTVAFWHFCFREVVAVLRIFICIRTVYSAK